MESFKGLVAGFFIGYLTFCIYKKIISYKKKKPSKFVMVVRTDAKMDKGEISKYCSQAALECYKKAKHVAPEYVKLWEYNSQPKIVLKLDQNSDTAFLKLQEEAQRAGVVSVTISRKEKTGNNIFVIGIGPAPENLIDKITEDRAIVPKALTKINLSEEDKFLFSFPLDKYFEPHHPA